MFLKNWLKVGRQAKYSTVSEEVSSFFVAAKESQRSRNTTKLRAKYPIKYVSSRKKPRNGAKQLSETNKVFLNTA